jgi:hypothetical protein
VGAVLRRTCSERVTETRNEPLRGSVCLLSRFREVDKFGESWTPLNPSMITALTSSPQLRHSILYFIEDHPITKGIIID